MIDCSTLCSKTLHARTKNIIGKLDENQNLNFFKGLGPSTETRNHFNNCAKILTREPKNVDVILHYITEHSF